MPRTIVLAYSGGLDTSIIVPWLRENYEGAKVICVAADIGQGDAELKGVRDKAIASGAAECYIEDLRAEFITDYIYPTLRAGAIYLGINFLLTRALRHIEWRLTPDLRAVPQPVLAPTVIEAH